MHRRPRPSESPRYDGTTWPETRVPALDLTTWLILAGTALLGSTVAGVTGFGTGVVLLPILAWTLGIRAVVPVMTITMLIGNSARIWWSRDEIDAAAVKRFLLGAIPATALGGVLYVGASTTSLGRIIGVFLLASVPLRRWLMSSSFKMRLEHFPILGAGIGFLSALVVTTGPMMTPFFLAYGLRRGGYIATDAMCTLGMNLTRGVVLARYALFTWETVAIGCMLGATMFVGAWIGRRLLERMSERAFVTMIEVLLVVMGLHFVLVSR